MWPESTGQHLPALPDHLGRRNSCLSTKNSMFYTSTEENLSSLSEQTAAQWGVMMKADGIHTRVWVWSRGGEFMRLFQGTAEILRACVYCLSRTISYWESDGPTPSSPLPSPPLPLCPLSLPSLPSSSWVSLYRPGWLQTCIISASVLESGECEDTLLHRPLIFIEFFLIF